MLFDGDTASDFNSARTLQLDFRETLQASPPAADALRDAAAPVIKGRGPADEMARAEGLIDFRRRPHRQAKMTIEETVGSCFADPRLSASGRQSPWSDRWGIHNRFTLIPSRAGDLEHDPEKGCSGFPQNHASIKELKRGDVQPTSSRFRDHSILKANLVDHDFPLPRICRVALWPGHAAYYFGARSRARRGSLRTWPMQRVVDGAI